MDDVFYVESIITGKRYNVFDCIKILNIQQVIYYLKNNVSLQDMKISEDRQTGKPCLVFYFIREDTREVYDEWCKRKEQV